MQTSGEITISINLRMQAIKDMRKFMSLLKDSQVNRPLYLAPFKISIRYVVQPAETISIILWVVLKALQQEESHSIMIAQLLISWLIILAQMILNSLCKSRTI